MLLFARDSFRQSIGQFDGWSRSMLLVDAVAHDRNTLIHYHEASFLSASFLSHKNG